MRVVGVVCGVGVVVACVCLPLFVLSLSLCVHWWLTSFLSVRCCAVPVLGASLFSFCARWRWGCVHLPFLLSLSLSLSLCLGGDGRLPFFVMCILYRIVYRMYISLCVQYLYRYLYRLSYLLV